MIVENGIKLRSNVRSVTLVLVNLLLLMLIVQTAIAAQPEPVTCDPKAGIWDFGLEWVVDKCVPKDMTDLTVVHYTNNYVTCDRDSKTVKLFAPYGDQFSTPAGLISSASSMTASDGRPYKIFRNSEGTHLLLVHPNYVGEIDGKDMTAYANGQVHTDVFDRGFVLSQTPICKKTPECKTCPCTETPSNSTVNAISGRLSHDQVLFSTKGGHAPLSVTLYYRSIPFAPSSIGNGWSHSYETVLQALANGAVTIWDNGKVRDYRLVAGTYKASPGDHSTLIKNGDGSYRLTEKNGLVRSFDAFGRIVGETDRNDNTTSYSYDSGKLVGVTDPNGRSATFTYFPDGKLQTIVDPMENVFTFAYTDGSLTTITHPDDGTWDFTYTTAGMLETKTDPIGNSSSYSYDSDNRVTGAVDPQGQARSYGFGGSPAGSPGKVPDPYPPCRNAVGLDPNGKLEVKTFGTCDGASLPVQEKNGGDWQYSYEYTSETLKSITDPYGKNVSYTHDGDGNVLTKTEPGVGTTWYTYDANGNTTSVKDALDYVTSYTYNTFAQILTSSGPQGSISNVYDANGNVTSNTDSGGATTEYEYDGKGNVIKITNAKNQEVNLTYTAANQIETSTDAAGIVTSYTYDDAGNMLTRTDVDGTTTYLYDEMNRLILVTDPINSRTTLEYDEKGNLVSRTDANDNSTSYKYNYQGQVIVEKDALDQKTNFAYGASACTSCGGVDKLTTLTDAKQQVTRYEYDLVSRLTKETDPLGKSVSYNYDVAGNLASKTDANGATIYFTHDALKRLTGKLYPDNSGETFTYDGAGRILTVTNKDISYTFTYDSGGRLSNVADSRGFVIAYENDILGGRTKMTVQPGTTDQRVTTYTYDAANRPKTITSSSGTFTYNYDSRGRRSSTSYPNGITTTNRYDALGRLTGIAHTGGGSTVAFANYSGFDNIGNRGMKVSERGIESYSYDPVYRLVQSLTPKGTENFTYDPVGNRLSGPGPKDTRYQYNAGNQMIVGRILDYLYDNNGNQVARTPRYASDKGWAETWDYENRLVRMERVKGAEQRTLTFKYDPMGRRIEKKMTETVGGESRTSTWTYVYDNDNIAFELYVDAAGTTTKTFYTHGAGVDEHLALERAGDSFFYHGDGLGSIAAITDVGGNVVQRYEYDSFGSVLPQSSFANAYTYTGREWDKETGLYYYRARYYDPMEGRFISKDPIGFQGGINLYNYVASNPINNTDPTGLIVKKCFRPLKNAFTNYHQYLIVGGVPYGYFGDSTVQSTDPLAGWGVHCVTITDDPCKEKCVKEKIKSFNPPTYGLLKYNCYSWVSDILSSCGL